MDKTIFSMNFIVAILKLHGEIFFVDLNLQYYVAVFISLEKFVEIAAFSHRTVYRTYIKLNF